MGDGLNFIYWNRQKISDTESIIKGIELNRSALLSGIINSLPIIETLLFEYLYSM